ncbi:MAG: carboxymuconolactone decarboxylase family protein [Gammaproteobacteria bacterium]
MPVIEPVPMEHLDPELRDLIAESRASGMLSTSVPNRIWAYRPELSKDMIRRYRLSFNNGILEPRLCELVRLRIAAFNDCVACKIARKSPEVSEEDVACLSSDDARFTPRERLALKFAELFVTDHFAIDDALFAQLGEVFSKAEIIELGFQVSGALAGGRLAHVLRAYENDEQPPVLRYEGEFAPAKDAKSAA